MARRAKTETELDKEIDEMFARAKPVEETLPALRKAIEALTNDPEFEADYLKSSFVNEILLALNEQNMTRTDLANRLGKKVQYVSRVLNETANFTIETMGADLIIPLKSNI